MRNNTTHCTCGAEIRYIEYIRDDGKPGKMPCETRRVITYSEHGHKMLGYPPHWANCPHRDRHRRNR